MKYYLFTTEMRVGGVERVISILAERWSRDVDVTVILLRDEIEFELPPSVRVITLDLATSPVHFFSGILAWRALRRVRHILGMSGGPFVFYSFLEMPNFVSVLLKKRFPNGVFIGGTRNNVLMYNRIFHLLYPCYRRLDAMIVNSSANRRLFITKFGLSAAKVFFIPNPIDFAAIERQAAEKAPILLEPILGRGPLIIAIGRLVKIKNYPLLLHAFARLSVSENGARLIILGDGPERRALLRQAKLLGIADRVIMPGMVTNPYVWMARCDLFVHCSNFEGWPNVLLEAMALGLPVVACDCLTGPAEILNHGAYGRLVPTNDLEALTDAMKERLRQEKMSYPHLREWDADIIAKRFREVVEMVSRPSNYESCDLRS